MNLYPSFGTEKYNGIFESYEKTETEYDEVTQTIADKEVRKNLIGQFIQTIKGQEPITKFDERLWVGLVDYVTIYGEKDIQVTFNDGTEIQE